MFKVYEDRTEEFTIGDVYFYHAKPQDWYVYLFLSLVICACSYLTVRAFLLVTEGFKDK